jgi:hypothetical protein
MSQRVGECNVFRLWTEEERGSSFLSKVDKKKKKKVASHARR